MNLILEIIRIVLPILIVGGMVIFVVMKMKQKYQTGTLGKKKSKKNQSLLDSLIPHGMITGCIMAIVTSAISSISLLSAFSMGPGLGLLFGYVAYEVYSKKEEKNF